MAINPIEAALADLDYLTARLRVIEEAAGHADPAAIRRECRLLRDHVERICKHLDPERNPRP